MLCDVSRLSSTDIDNIITLALYEFPVKQIEFKLPKWVRALPYENDFIQEILNEVKSSISGINKMSEHVVCSAMFEQNDNIKNPQLETIKLADGSVSYNIDVSNKVFYGMLSKECGVDIEDDFYLMSYIKHLTYAKQEYDKVNY